MKKMEWFVAVAKDIENKKVVINNIMYKPGTSVFYRFEDKENKTMIILNEYKLNKISLDLFLEIFYPLKNEKGKLLFNNKGSWYANKMYHSIMRRKNEEEKERTHRQKYSIREEKKELKAVQN
uniref:Uncharacterized protein n=1 Tax=viral metagenome TaxID=1070528 RepID=A0A6M3LRH6_9ZZZZ